MNTSPIVFAWACPAPWCGWRTDWTDFCGADPNAEVWLEADVEQHEALAHGIPAQGEA